MGEIFSRTVLEVESRIPAGAQPCLPRIHAAVVLLLLLRWRRRRRCPQHRPWEK